MTSKRKSSRLFVSASWVMMLAIVGALTAAQWKHQPVPLTVVALLLVLMVIKARLIVLDFMGLRGVRPATAAALLAWPSFFAVAGLGRGLSAFWIG
ncbi:MAG: cytochrome C oxidase subunit IV family protein [Pseudorhizobium sp.]